MQKPRHNYENAFWLALATIALTMLIVGATSTAYNRTGYRQGYYQALRDLAICAHSPDLTAQRNYYQARTELENRNELPPPTCSK
jgi:hypothetical protein